MKFILLILALLSHFSFAQDFENTQEMIEICLEEFDRNELLFPLISPEGVTILESVGTSNYQLSMDSSFTQAQANELEALKEQCIQLFQSQLLMQFQIGSVADSYKCATQVQAIYAKGDGLNDLIGDLKDLTSVMRAQFIEDTDNWSQARRRNEQLALRNGKRLLETNLEIFNEVNDLEPPVTSENEFMLRTVKNPGLNPQSFTRNAQVLEVMLQCTLDANKTSISSVGMMRPCLEENGVSLSREEQEYYRGYSNYLVNAFNSSALKQAVNALAPAAVPNRLISCSGGGNCLAQLTDEEKRLKLIHLKELAAKMANPSDTMTSEEFYILSSFMPSKKQVTTLMVKDHNGNYLPVKEMSPGEGFEASLAIGTKLFQGDNRQPEGFMRTNYHGDTGLAKQYFKMDVMYPENESEDSELYRGVREMRTQLGQSRVGQSRNGSRLGIGGQIRIHPEEGGSIGCLILPNEESTMISSIAHRENQSGTMVSNGNNPSMMTIPFELTDENLDFFSQKIQDSSGESGHIKFWNQLKAQEKELNYSYAIPVNRVLD
tara:strand:- start:90464 stop:92104 length:1641 start_codon:yes stop_codon:yes gene_type:complete